MTIDLSRTGAVSDDRATEQIAEVAAVYAGKSETPESGARTTQYEIGRTVSVTYHCATHGDWDALRASGCPECVRQMRGEIRALEKESARLRKTMIPLISALTSCRIIIQDKEARDYAGKICDDARALLSLAPTERADK